MNILYHCLESTTVLLISLYIKMNKEYHLSFKNIKLFESDILLFRVYITHS